MELNQLSPEQKLQIAQKTKDKLINDLDFYASNCLMIRTKIGTIEPFFFNKAQHHLHLRLEEQKSKIGRVRAIVLKGRQQGISTYIAARFYHKVTTSLGLRVFILTHEQEATDNLFGMVNRYHEHCDISMKPHTGASNAKELYFDVLQGGYKVGTAGTKAVGRSQTIQLFHGSESAFWPNAETHAAGVLQAVADMGGTEVILESTANGLGNYYHKMWQDAEAGLSEFIPIFIPWYWQPEYIKQPGPNFEYTDEETEYARTYQLTDKQIAWRRAKIVQLGDDLLFKQEYPATAAEAFQLTGHDSFIAPELVLRARKHNIKDPEGLLVLGIDPARYGDDRFSIAWRKGRKVLKIENRNKIDTVSSANWIKTIIDEDKPAKAFVDVGGIGGGVIDILRSWGPPYSDIIKSINFGSEPQEHRSEGGPRNRRAEMWSRSKEWLCDPAGVSIPDSDALQADACAPGYKYDMKNKLLLEGKEDMRKRGVRSPDEWDAIALTFAEPVTEKKPIVFNPNRSMLPYGDPTIRNDLWLGR